MTQAVQVSCGTARGATGAAALLTCWARTRAPSGAGWANSLASSCIGGSSQASRQRQPLLNKQATAKKGITAQAFLLLSHSYRAAFLHGCGCIVRARYSCGVCPRSLSHNPAVDCTVTCVLGFLRAFLGSLGR